MKIFVVCLVLLSASGCASVISEYNQGCRDGMNAFGNDDQRRNADVHCDSLDAVRESHRRHMEHLGRRSL